VESVGSEELVVEVGGGARRGLNPLMREEVGSDDGVDAMVGVGLKVEADGPERGKEGDRVLREAKSDLVRLSGSSSGFARG